MLTTRSKVSFGKMRNLLQIVYAGMLGSLATLSAIAYMLFEKVDISTQLPSAVLLAGGALLSVISIGVCAFLPKLVTKQVDRDRIVMRLHGVVYSQILFAAGFEGAGLFWATLAVLMKNPYCLIGPAVAIFVLAIHFPTTTRLEAAMEMNEDQIERELEKRDA